MLLNKIDTITNRVINALFESKQIDKNYVYHVARNSTTDDSGYKKIFKFGFERFYVNKGVGNMYGAGIYTTIDLDSSIENAKRGEYGNIIIRAEILSYDKFIIWNETLAKMVYRHNWQIKNQFHVLFPREVINKMKEDGIYDNLTSINTYTSDNALSFWRYSRTNDSKFNPYNYIDGFVFYGRRDGHVAVVKDVKNLSPYQYSDDYGKTWHMGQNEKTIRYTKGDFDAEYKFGKKYKTVSPPEFGWAKVTNNTSQVNYINKNGEEISPIWFDGGGNFIEMTNDEKMANIVYKDNSLWLTTSGTVYLSPNDEYMLCPVEELSDYI